MCVRCRHVQVDPIQGPCKYQDAGGARKSRSAMSTAAGTSKLLRFLHVVCACFAQNMMAGAHVRRPDRLHSCSKAWPGEEGGQREPWRLHAQVLPFSMHRCYRSMLHALAGYASLPSSSSPPKAMSHRTPAYRSMVIAVPRSVRPAVSALSVCLSL